MGTLDGTPGQERQGANVFFYLIGAVVVIVSLLAVFLLSGSGKKAPEAPLVPKKTGALTSAGVELASVGGLSTQHQPPVLVHPGTERDISVNDLWDATDTEVHFHFVAVTDDEWVLIDVVRTDRDGNLSPVEYSAEWISRFAWLKLLIRTPDLLSRRTKLA